MCAGGLVGLVAGGWILVLRASCSPCVRVSSSVAVRCLAAPLLAVGGSERRVAGCGCWGSASLVEPWWGRAQWCWLAALGVLVVGCSGWGLTGLVVIGYSWVTARSCVPQQAAGSRVWVGVGSLVARRGG